MILCCVFYIASAVPRSRTAYHSIPALEGSINLIVLSKCGRIAKGEICDEITGLHAFVQMVGLLTVGSAYPTHEGHVYGVVFHRNDRERRRWGSIQDRRSVQSHTVGERQARVRPGSKGCHTGSFMSRTVQSTS